MKLIATILALLFIIVGASNLTQKKALSKIHDYMPKSLDKSKRVSNTPKFTEEELKMEIESALPVDDKVADDSLNDKPSK